MVLRASLGDVPELAAVLTLGEPIGGDDGGDLSGSGEEANRGTHGIDVRSLTDTATEVASFPWREVGSRLRNLAERMEMPLAFLTEVASASKRSSGSEGRYEIGREWMASCDSFGANLNGSHGDNPTGKDWLSLEVMASKKGV